MNKPRCTHVLLDHIARRSEILVSGNPVLDLRDLASGGVSCRRNVGNAQERRTLGCKLVDWIEGLEGEGLGRRVSRTGAMCSGASGLHACGRRGALQVAAISHHMVGKISGSCRKFDGIYEKPN